MSQAESCHGICAVRSYPHILDKIGECPYIQKLINDEGFDLYPGCNHPKVGLPSKNGDIIVPEDVCPFIESSTQPEDFSIVRQLRDLKW